MAQAPHVQELLRRLSGEIEPRDTLARVARELRRRHDDLHERPRRTNTPARAGENRRGVRSSAAMGAGRMQARGDRVQAFR